MAGEWGLNDIRSRIAALEAGGPGGGAAWGSITGTLSAQTDLQAALNGKQAAGSYVTTVNFTWANLAGKPSTFTPSAHTHPISDVTNLQTTLDGKEASGTAASTMAAHTGASDPHPQYLTQAEGDALYAPVGGGGSSLSGTATLTVPNGRFEWEETVSAAGVTSTAKVIPALAPTPHTAENCPELLDLVTLSAEPGAGTITFGLTFREPTSGPLLVNWSAF